VYTARLQNLLDFFPERTRVCLPVADIAIHRDVSLAGVGLKEYDSNVLFYGCRGGTDDVEVVEEPRKGCMIFAGPRLERLVWLYCPKKGDK
jgi:hypothetical protein